MRDDAAKLIHRMPERKSTRKSTSKFNLDNERRSHTDVRAFNGACRWTRYIRQFRDRSLCHHGLHVVDFNTGTGIFAWRIISWKSAQEIKTPGSGTSCMYVCTTVHVNARDVNETRLGRTKGHKHFSNFCAKYVIVRVYPSSLRHAL